MELSATLNGKRCTSARVTIPAWGIWFADASLDGEATLTGPVELRIADLVLKGTIMSGGPTLGRSHFRIVGGGGGWGKTLPAKSYANDAEVKLSTVLTDAATEAGETLDAKTLPATRVGSHYTRDKGAASRALELVSKGSWYIGEDGVTRLGARPASKLPANVTHEPVDLARGCVTLASDSIAKILPGVVTDGLTAVDVEHTISAEGGLRSTIWGKRGAGMTRTLYAIRRAVEALFPQLPFLGTWEYRIVTQEGKRLNLQPVRVSTGMPDLRLVPVRPGLAGSDSEHALGARVLVTFIDGQPGRPCVIALEDADGSGFKPILTEIDAQTLVKLGAGMLPVARLGDIAGGIWPIATTQVKVVA